MYSQHPYTCTVLVEQKMIPKNEFPRTSLEHKSEPKSDQMGVGSTKSSQIWKKWFRQYLKCESFLDYFSFASGTTLSSDAVLMI